MSQDRFKEAYDMISIEDPEYSLEYALQPMSQEDIFYHIAVTKEYSPSTIGTGWVEILSKERNKDKKRNGSGARTVKKQSKLLQKEIIY